MKVYKTNMKMLVNQVESFDKEQWHDKTLREIIKAVENSKP